MVGPTEFHPLSSNSPALLCCKPSASDRSHATLHMLDLQGLFLMFLNVKSLEGFYNYVYNIPKKFTRSNFYTALFSMLLPPFIFYYLNSVLATVIG